MDFTPVGTIVAMHARTRLAASDDTQAIARVSDEHEPGSPVPAHRRRSRRRRRALLIVLMVFVTLIGGGLVAASLYLRSVESGVKRVNAFGAVPEVSRPAKADVAKDAMNFLVLGSDTRDPSNTTGSRSDTIMLMHVSRDRSSAQVVSIPRDTWLHVPKSRDGNGNADAKINAAFAWGGIPLTVQTVEGFTGVRVDHVVIVDFAGFKEIIDALGGVEINVEEGFTSTHSLNSNSIRVFRKGPQVMDGAAALDYSRERFAFSDGDFARIRHQQQMIKAVLDKAASGGVLANPVRLNAFLRATANAVTVDSTLNITDVAMDLRHLRSENLSFYTSPNKGTATIGDQSVVLADTARAKALFDAIRRDDAAAIAAAGA
jgi:LCP family protein required for cell wall assembly